MRPSFPLRALALCTALAACQSPTAEQAAPAPMVPAAPVDGVGYVVFDAIINHASSAALIKDFEALQAQGAHEIDVAMSSPGGVVDDAQSIVAAMDRLHTEHGVVFTVYDMRLVASAATLVFLNAQSRYATPRSSFVFHAVSLLAVGSFSAERLRQDADRIDRDTQMFRELLLRRTRLTRPQVDVYVSRAVVLSADDALQDGVIDAIRAPTAPKGAGAWVIRSKPRPTPAAPAPATG